MLGDVVYLGSIKCVKAYFLQSLKYSDRYIYAPSTVNDIFLQIQKNCTFSYYNDANPDAYACGHKVRMYLQMQIVMRVGLFRTQFFAWLKMLAFSLAQGSIIQHIC